MNKPTIMQRFKDIEFAAENLVELIEQTKEELLAEDDHDHDPDKCTVDNCPDLKEGEPDEQI